jgi:hypothetical protein
VKRAKQRSFLRTAKRSNDPSECGDDGCAKRDAPAIFQRVTRNPQRLIPSSLPSFESSNRLHVHFNLLHVSTRSLMLSSFSRCRFADAQRTSATDAEKLRTSASMLPITRLISSSLFGIS